MPKNMGKIDRIIRIILAVVLVFVASSSGSTSSLYLPLIVFGAILVVTSTIGTCPLYIPFKINTKK